MIDYIEGLNLYKIGNLIPKIEIIQFILNYLINENDLIL